MRKLKLITLLCLCLISSAFAGVNLKNGNFYISYSDFKLNSTTSAWKFITRTYNSKSTYTGLFGYGWGTDMETYLGIYPDGSITVREYGAGGSSFFKSEFATDDMVNAMIDQLVTIAIEQGDIKNNPNAILKKRDNLKNLEHRTATWDKYVKKGFLRYIQDFPEGMDWTSTKNGNQKIIKTKDGYIRESTNETETFNSEGKLIKLDKGNGAYSEFEYKNGHISKIINADNSVLLITTNQDGLITSISNSTNKSEYKYQDSNLIYSKDSDGNHYAHEYDKNHNMTKIIYNPKRLKGEAIDAMSITYEPKTLFCSEIIDRNGEVTNYEYKSFYNEDGSEDADHYATTVIKDGYYGDKTSNYYEYQIKTKANGERFNYMIVKEINGIRTTTFYDELCNNPTEITSGSNKTTFKYNNRCLLEEKTTATGDTISLKYHPNFDKITSSNVNGVITTFKYDSNKNLIKAERNDGVWIALIYAQDNHIKVMKQNDKTLNFEYNAKGKPIKIEMENVGNMTINYDENGEIASVNSDEGHSMALQITQAFQNMLSLVKPSGVNFDL